VKLPLNTDKSSDYGNIIRNELGKQGLIQGEQAKMTMEQKLYLKFKLINDNDFSENTYGLTIDDLIGKDFTLSIIFYCLNVKTRSSLDKLGFKLMHLYNRKVVGEINVLRSYGIDRIYVMNKAKIEGYPVIHLFNVEDDVETTPLEAMVRGGYSLKDFISMGWYSEGFIEDGATPAIYYNVIRNAFCTGMKFDKVRELFRIHNDHLDFYKLSNIEELLNKLKVVNYKPEPILKTTLLNSIKTKNNLQQERNVNPDNNTNRVSSVISNSLRIKEILESKQSRQNKNKKPNRIGTSPLNNHK
jgi:hypothetical protein